MRRLGKMKNADTKTIEAYAIVCSPTTKCASQFLCSCGCPNSGASSLRMSTQQTTNCKVENSKYWSNYLRMHGKSPYSSTCLR
ncbi:MAG: hypothetical protein IJM37_11130 [Lachnospiraceae bacterium]|nr:hypothetical protein [Lachnospiraceae bacterium]